MMRVTVPQIGASEIEAVAAVLRSGMLVQGEHVAAFEQKVAAYLGIRHAVAVSSGTAALHLALLALDIGPGDEVIVPDFTFPATANVVERVGATPVLVDIDLATYNIDPHAVRAALGPKTRAIMPVHLFGQSADMQPIVEMAQRRRIAVIEDAACALGAEYRGRACGTLGRLGCFSFHPRKTITTGEGGMIVTADDALADRLRLLRSHGMRSAEGRVVFEVPGLNYRLTDFQGALGAAQMDRLETILAARARLASVYHHVLRDVPGIVVPHTLPDARHVWQSYVVRLTQVPRERVQQELRAAGIETTIGTHALSRQPCYRKYRLDLPHARSAYEQCLTLPLHGGLTAADVEHVATTLTRVLRSCR